ncbi:MAG: class B sortase [Clostridiales bacterium]|nr:class B sortase [Clostridiales bacterium]
MVKKTKSVSRKRRVRRSKRIAMCVLILALVIAAVLGVLAYAEINDRKAGVDYYDSLASANQTDANTASQSVDQASNSQGSASGDQSSQSSIDDYLQSFTDDDDEYATSAQQQPSAADQSGTDQSGTDQSAPEATAANAIASTAEPEKKVVVQSEIDFETLWKTCPDVVGWIRCEGTVIDYPIVQGTDNDYYLAHLPDGTANRAGSIMMDVSCDPAFTNDVTILHGHNMKSGKMFGDLFRFGVEEYYLRFPILRLYTPSGDYDVEIFAGCTVNGATFGYPTVFASEEEYIAFVEKIVKATAYETNVEVNYPDEILLLSTCAYSYQNQRFILAGKIMFPED